MREPDDVAKPALASLGLEGVHQVVHADLSSLGVTATPELLIVNEKARVESSWMGKLSESKEKEVYAKLNVVPVQKKSITIVQDPSAPATVPAEDVSQLLRGSGVIVIDSRTRDSFEKGHIRGAVTMPLDEILSRAPHELPTSEPVFVFCDYQEACASKMEREGTMSFCALTGVVLEQAGLKNVRYLNANLADLEAKGVPLVGDACK